MPLRSARPALAAGLAIGLLAIGGCTTDDPSEGGFFGGVVGLASGWYARNAEDRERLLKAQRARQRELEARRERTEAERREVNADVEARRREAGEVTEEMRELGDEARWLRVGMDLTERERMQVEEDIGAVELELLRLRLRRGTAPADRTGGP